MVLQPGNDDAPTPEEEEEERGEGGKGEKRERGEGEKEKKRKEGKNRKETRACIHSSLGHSLGIPAPPLAEMLLGLALTLLLKPFLLFK